ncbi:hypothetical protein ONS95_009215 [Cadophora gregata]|uniref:uncharacterized protein n=1 Tax=Cadophora gregata TaxID=51156 RepID=UPI0026DC6FCB|nr:uncharacterized protein ONS95_009215 [Cadophora gregata]KAK0124240.1 hypothetical protein ONS95_009215 [Cadophora gregata]KAK0129907.1 hypothetical protein ONS96_000452 [Cadophora gregata f. sp. sojae]
MADTSYLESLQAGAGLDPNDHSSMSSSIIWTTSVLMAAVASFVLARLFVRGGYRPSYAGIDHSRTLGNDDYIMFGACVATIFLAMCSIIGAWSGLGRHIMDILREDPDPKLENTQSLIQILYGCYVCYSLANALTKLSIIASYLRIFPSVHFRRAMWVLGVFVVLQALTSVVTIIFECDPVESSWNWNVKRKRCIDIQLFFYVTSAINTATDFALWAAPMPYFWKSRMSRKQRIELVLLYSIGLLSCLSGLFRLGQLKGLKSLDITYHGALPLNCSMGEVSLGIICACIPPLRPAFRPILKKFRLYSRMSPVDKAKVTPVSTPQTSQHPYFERRRERALSRIAEDGPVENIEFDEFEESFRQYLGSSVASLRPSDTGTIGERGSATSTRLFL